MPKNLPMALQDKTFIITGAGKGLGRGYALHLASLGANVVVNNRSHVGETPSSAASVVAEIIAAGGKAVAEQSDAEDTLCGARLLQTALDSFGGIDGLVANAGVSEGTSFNKQDLAQFRRTIEINLMGTVNAVHPVYQHLYQQGHGSIVVSTSVAGLYGEHGLPAYSTSKAGLLGLMYALSKEGGRHNLRINALAPYAATQMTDEYLTDELRQQMHPERVAPVVAWLMNESCGVNGEIIIAGGGLMGHARVSEPVPVPIADEADFATIDQAWKQLREQPLEREYRSALQHSAAFLKP
ncbi:MAG: SDR family NAD(P)-dependent oxidoreductase [Xanthomonadales bacterium]|nr:SDR family NAD(P)-dependent oxidoreductase [Xanthomonadales bacterium]